MQRRAGRKTAMTAVALCGAMPAMAWLGTGSATAGASPTTEGPLTTLLHGATPAQTTSTSTATVPTPPTTTPPVTPAPTTPTPAGPSPTTVPPVTTTGAAGTPAVTSGPAVPPPAAAPTPASTAASQLGYYGNPKTGVQILSSAPGQYPTGTGNADLSGFIMQAAHNGTVNGTCSTSNSGTQGTCDMDPNHAGSFPMTGPTEGFTFSVASLPLGWVINPDEPTLHETVSACSTTSSASDPCTGSPNLFDAYLLPVIGAWRTIEVSTTSALTHQPLPAGVSVTLTCTGGTGACAPSSATETTDGTGSVTFPGLYAPGAQLTISEDATSMPAPYGPATTMTETVPAPTGSTGAEVSASAKTPVDYTLASPATLAPVAVTTYEDTPIPVTGLQAANAKYFSKLTISGVDQPTAPRHGTATFYPFTPHVSYTPDPGFVGTDTFSYDASSGTAAGPTPETALDAASAPAASGTVTVTVVALPPTAKPDHVTTPEDTPVAVALKPLVTAPAGTTVTFAATRPRARHGRVKVAGSTATYTPDHGFLGKDTFDYTVTDSNGRSAHATITVTVVKATPAPPTTTAVTTPATSGTGATSGYTQPYSDTSSTGSTGSSGLAFTGTDIIATTGLAALLIGAGAVLVRFGRRRRRT